MTCCEATGYHSPNCKFAPGAVKLAPGWLRRDVDKAVEQERCYKMVLKLDTAELTEWHRAGRAIIRRRTQGEKT